MANNGKYLSLTNGFPNEELAIVQSAGATDASKIIRSDATGRLDLSLMPVGVTAEVQTITTTEALAAGAWVNIYNSGGIKVRNADGTTAGKPVDGFVLAAFANGVAATVYLEGVNTAVSGRTPGAIQFLATTAGTSTETALSASGNSSQMIGKAISATAVSFTPLYPITLA